MNEIQLYERSPKRDPTDGITVHEQSVSDIQNILEQFVVPYTPDAPRVLVVGFGNRVEECIAIHDSLNPTHITAIDPGLTTNTKLKWGKYVVSQKFSRQFSLFSRVTMKDTYLEDVKVPYDVVFCFSISPMLQNDEDILHLAEISKSLLVVTAHKDGGIRFGDVSEPDHIDILLRNNIQTPGLFQKERLQVQTNDGYVWIVGTDSSHMQ